MRHAFLLDTNHGNIVSRLIAKTRVKFWAHLSHQIIVEPKVKSQKYDIVYKK